MQVMTLTETRSKATRATVSLIAWNLLETDRTNLKNGQIDLGTILKLAFAVVSAGDRSFRGYLANTSTWVELLWVNSSTLFKLANQAGTLQRLQIADPTASSDAATKNYVDNAGIMGEIKTIAGSSTPSKTLLTFGQAVSRSTYSALFTAIGTTYGAGDGSTTFNLPDGRGRLDLGKDNMGGSTAGRVTSASTGGGNATTLGGTGGGETATLSIANLAAHDHNPVTINYQNTGSAGGTGVNMLSSNTNAGTNSSFVSVASTGSGTAFSITSPWIVYNKVIYTGV
jgi:microcystin-dependent protein